jgi:hypothetical protein
MNPIVRGMMNKYNQRTQRRGAGSAWPMAKWTVPMAKRCPAPVWHLPQVAAMFLGLMVEAGSEGALMLWTPWQLAQFATVSAPDLLAKP